MKIDANGNTWATVASLPKGEFLKRNVGAATTWIRGEYSRGAKAYSLIDFDDMSREMFVKGSKEVVIGFTF